MVLGVQVLEDEVESHVNCIIYRPVGSVGKLQERVCDEFELGQDKVLKGLHYHKCQSNR